MSTPIKTILRFVWFVLLLAVVVGFSGWVLLVIPVAGSLIDPSPQHAMLWQHLMVNCLWAGIWALLPAIAAMIVFCPAVAFGAWMYSRRKAPSQRITSDDLLRLPTREQWADCFHVGTVASIAILISTIVIGIVNPAWQWSQVALICSTLFFVVMMVGELIMLFVSDGRVNQQEQHA